MRGGELPRLGSAASDARQGNKLSLATVEAFQNTGLAIQDVDTILGVHSNAGGCLQPAEAALWIHQRANRPRRLQQGQGAPAIGQDSILEICGAPSREAIENEMWFRVDHRIP